MLKKIASNTISQILSKVFTAIISIFLIKALTTYLPVETYWLYNKIYSYLGIFAFLADLWLYTITVREIRAWKEKTSKIIWNVMTLRMMLWVIIIFLSLIIAYFLPWYNTQVALIAVFITAIFTLFGLLNSSILALMQANMKIEFSLVSRVLGKIVNLWLILLGVYILFPEINKNFELSFSFIMFAGLAWVAINTYLNYLYAKKIDDIRFRFDLDYIKHIFKISLPYWIALFLSVVYFKIDIVLLSLIETQAKSDTSIALYSVPMRIIEVLMVLSGFFLNSVLPMMSKSFALKELEKIWKILSNSYKTLLAFWFSIVALGSVFKNDIIRLVATPDYIDNIKYVYTSSDVFTVTLFILLFYFISQLFIYTLIASENQKRLLYINMFVAVFNIIWNILIIPKYSFLGSAYITVASQIILLIMLIYFSRDIYKFRFPIFYTIRVIWISLIIFFLWRFLIDFKDLGIIWNILIYWWFLWSIMWAYYFVELRKILKNRV